MPMESERQVKDDLGPLLSCGKEAVRACLIRWRRPHSAGSSKGWTYP